MFLESGKHTPCFALPPEIYVVCFLISFRSLFRYNLPERLSLTIHEKPSASSLYPLLTALFLCTALTATGHYLLSVSSPLEARKLREDRDFDLFCYFPQDLEQCLARSQGLTKYLLI